MFSIHLPIVLSCLFMILLVIIPSASSLSFNLPNIGPQNQNIDIITEGDAYISHQGIQVTPYEIGSVLTQKAGRATYIRPLHLYDNVTGQLADFSTNFTFVIDSNRATVYGDGLAFFLAHNSSVITAGGAIGLPINASTIIPTDQFVAVEFDTFWNSGWDPRSLRNTSIEDHVGININSLTSVKAQKWHRDISTIGREYEARIKYESASKLLSIGFTGYQNNTRILQSGLEYRVDLRNELPEWVNFGFTASTGAFFQKNNVKSWSFYSSDLQEL